MDFSTVLTVPWIISVWALSVRLVKSTITMDMSERFICVTSAPCVGPLRVYECAVVARMT